MYCRPRHVVFLFVWAGLLSVVLVTPLHAQRLPIPNELLTWQFGTRVKIVDQFIDRFNNQDFELQQLWLERTGKVITRREAITTLISDYIDSETVGRFLRTIELHDSKLDYYAPGWYASGDAVARYEGASYPLQLTLRVEKTPNGGSRWVLAGANAPFLLKRDKENATSSIDPMNHSVNFTDLYRLFDGALGSWKGAAPTGYEMDHLTLLFQSIADGTIIFEGFSRLEYTFFQVNGWVIIVSNQNDLADPRGWTIRTLIEASSDEMQNYLRTSLYVKD